MKKTFFLIQLFGLGIAVALSACNSDDAAAPPAADPFAFSTQTPDRFVRVDRMGAAGNRYRPIVQRSRRIPYPHP